MAVTVEDEVGEVTDAELGAGVEDGAPLPPQPPTATATATAAAAAARAIAGSLGFIEEDRSDALLRSRP